MKKKKSRFKFRAVILLALLAALLMRQPLKQLLARGNYFNQGDYHSRSIYVYNLTEDREVLSIRADEKRAQASFTKIMTTYVALQKIEDLSAPAPVVKEAHGDMVRAGSSMAGFEPGEETTYRDLLYGTVLASGGECALSLAFHLAESQADFVGLMNDQARAFGLKDTVYKNVTGLDQKGQYSTARDTSMLLKECLKNGHFRAIFTKKEFASIPTLVHPKGIRIQSTVFKRLPAYEQKGFEIIGGKSGTTREAGLCWATLAEKNGQEVLVVVMGAPFKDISNPGDDQIKDTLKILENL